MMFIWYIILCTVEFRTDCKQAVRQLDHRHDSIRCRIVVVVHARAHRFLLARAAPTPHHLVVGVGRHDVVAHFRCACAPLGAQTRRTSTHRRRSIRFSCGHPASAPQHLHSIRVLQVHDVHREPTAAPVVARNAKGSCTACASAGFSPAPGNVRSVPRTTPRGAPHRKLRIVCVRACAAITQRVQNNKGQERRGGGVQPFSTLR